MSASLSGLTLQADGYTHFAAALLVVNFIMVQAHFWTMLKHDHITSESTGIKVLCGLSIAFEFLVLTPLFFISKIDANSAIVFLLAGLGFNLVDLFCFIISMMKTWMIHAQMYSEGRIASHETQLKWAVGLVVIGTVIGYFAQFGSLLTFIGFCLYLHVLNVMRKSNGPHVTSRMFWAQIGTILVAVVMVIVLLVMIFKIADSTQLANQTSGSKQITEADVIAIWNMVKGYFVVLVLLTVVDNYLHLLTTGHYIGDACGNRPPLYANIHNVENGIDDDMEGGERHNF
jgi:hypothetical protein